VCVCGRVCGDVQSEREALHCGNATEILFLVRMRNYIFFRPLIQLKVSVCQGDMSEKYRAVIFEGLGVIVNSKALGEDILRAP